MERNPDPYGVVVYDALLLLAQLFAAVAGLAALLLSGYHMGGIEPFVFVTGWESIGYFFVIGLSLALLIAIPVVLYAVAGTYAWIKGSDLDDRLVAATTSVAGDRGATAFTYRSILGTAVGAVVGVNLVFGVPDWMSVELSAVALAAGGAALLLGGYAVERSGVGSALYAAGTVAYVVLLPAVTTRVSELLTILVPVVLVVSLLGGRWILRVADPDSRRVAVPVVAALLLTSGGALAYDAAGPRPSVSVDHPDRVEFENASTVSVYRSDSSTNHPILRVGTLSVRNEFGFPRIHTVPEYAACLYTADGGPYPAERDARDTALMVVERFDDGGVSEVDDVKVAGGTAREYELVVYLDSFENLPAERLRELGSVPVRTADRCPDSTDGPALVVVPGDGG